MTTTVPASAADQAAPLDVVQTAEPSQVDVPLPDVRPLDTGADPAARPTIGPFLERDPAPPSPDEIRAACLEIQRGWSDAERERRIAGPRFDRATVPVVRACAAVPWGE